MAIAVNKQSLGKTQKELRELEISRKRRSREKENWSFSTCLAESNCLANHSPCFILTR